MTPLELHELVKPYMDSPWWCEDLTYYPDAEEFYLSVYGKSRISGYGLAQTLIIGAAVEWLLAQVPSVNIAYYNNSFCYEVHTGGDVPYERHANELVESLMLVCRAVEKEREAASPIEDGHIAGEEVEEEEEDDAPTTTNSNNEDSPDADWKDEEPDVDG